MEHVQFRNLLGGEISPLLVTRDNLPKGYPVHNHDFNELVFIAEGTAVHVINGQHFPCGAGELRLIRSVDTHGFLSSNNLTVYNFIMRPQDMEVFLGDLRTLPTYQYLFLLEPQKREVSQDPSGFRLTQQQKEYLASRADIMVQECKTQLPGFQGLVKGLFLQTLTEICRETQMIDQQLVPTFGRIISTLTHIEAQFSQDLNIRELAQRSNLSTRHFQRLFRELIGTSPLEYLIQIRIDRAKRLLKNTPLSITEIAFLCGFQDSNYFSRTFKAIVKIPPREYRKRIQSSSCIDGEPDE